MDAGLGDWLVDSYLRARQRILFLDYDGCLVALQEDPADAIPDPVLLQMISCIIKQAETTIVIVTGRNVAFLEQNFAGIPIDYAAEYGAMIKIGGIVQECCSKAFLKGQFTETLRKHIKSEAGIFIEQKDYGVVVHFKGHTCVDTALPQALLEEIQNVLIRYDLQLYYYANSIEIRPRRLNKGIAVQHWLKSSSNSFLFSVGDNDTDEDMFKSLPTSSYCVRVGPGATSANLRVGSYMDVRKFLQQISALMVFIFNF